MRTPFRDWLGAEAGTRDPDASLDAIERRVAKPARPLWWLAGAIATAAVALAVLTYPRTEVIALTIAEPATARAPLELEMTLTRRYLEFSRAPVAAALLGALVNVAHAQAPATQVLAEPWTRRIDIELKEVEVVAALGVVAEVAEAKLVTDACVAGRKVDLKLRNVPAQVVLEALTIQLGLTYRVEGGVLRVGCGG